MKIHTYKYWLASMTLLTSSLLFQGCGGGDSGTDTSNTTRNLSLNQAGYNVSTQSYQYGYESIPNINITGAPADLDWSRWAMLHDGRMYRLLFFKVGTNDTLYQFGFNPRSSDYEFGYLSVPEELKIAGVPTDADPTSFAMLHDGTRYRLYMRSLSNPARIYQFAYNSATRRYEYGFAGAIPRIDVTGAPADVDWDRWGMLHDGTTYRHYAMRKGSNTQMYQFGYNTAARAYQYGFNSIPVLTVQNMPQDSDTNNFAMLHDGSHYRFYFLKF
jgi:hypothetical protein